MTDRKYDALQAFCALTGMGVRVTDAAGRTLFAAGETGEPAAAFDTVFGKVTAGPCADAKAAEKVISRLLPDTEIPDSLYDYTVGAKRMRYSYAKEKELLSIVRSGSRQRVRPVLNALLGDVLFSNFTDIRSIRVRAMELSSLLSRVAIDGGASGERMLQMNERFIGMLEKAADVDGICVLLMRIAEEFLESMFSERKLTEPVKRAVAYLGESFASPVTLEITARHVGLAPTYFSAVFKKETGMTFREYLNRVRVEEAQRLLTGTDFDIVDIAMATGFEEQSYFSKVFRKYTGTSPKKYRDGR